MASLNDFQEQLDILSATKTSIKEAIIGKGQEVSSEDSFSSYADKIDDIVTLEEGTTDATATASDILSSKTAYVNGNKITGSMRAYLTGEGTAYTDMTYFSDDTSSNRLRVTIKLKANNDGYVSSNFGLTQLIPYSSIQNKVNFLSAGNIKNGVTILGVQGSVVELNGETASVTPTTSQQTIVPTGTGKNALTEVTVNAVTSAIDNNIQAGNIKKGVTILGVSGKSSVVDTDNANATANDIIYGKSAYVNGHKINGQMIKHVGDSTYANQLSVPDNTDHFNMYYTSANDKIYIGNFKIGSGYWDGTASSNAYIDKNLVYTKLGLTANKLKVGESVLGVQGTFTSDATATNSDIASGKTAYVNGRKVVGVIVDRRNSGASIVGADVTGTNPHRVTITGTGSSTDEIINSSTSISCEIANNLLASGIGLTADKIKQGVTIIGITGTFTNDADATASDILSSKTAYVNGQKVTGTISSIGWGFNEAQLGDMSLNNHNIYINPVVSQTSGFYTPGVQAKIITSYSNIATLIGLSADKIKQGETILDIAGTYVGSAMKEYASTTAMNNDIANISDGEVVKVDDGTTLDYYIKDTTMVKLIKESETISPQDFEEAEEQIGDLFGEEENN